MTYPNGRVINYNYGSGMANANAALDQAIGRLDAIVDGANSGDAGQILEQYSYLGLSTIVARNHPQTGINLTLIGASGSIGSGGDQYVGLDQFGRVVNQNWINTTGTTNTTVDGYTYTYDSNGNVLSKSNVLDSAYSETYTYDSLNRLTSVARGGASYQSWNLDTQGNWNSFTSNGVQQTRTANAQNELTSVSGLLAPVYDANWNTTAVIGYNLTSGTWNVVQRYVYSPYGSIIILNPDFSTTPAGTVPIVNNLYQGMPLDPATGLYYERARWYSPSLGTWISQDPAGYINGANTYQFVGSDPVGRFDRTGESQDSYVPDRGRHGGPHVDRYNPQGQNVGRYTPQGKPIPHKGNIPPPIPSSDRKKFEEAADQLKEAGTVFGGALVGVGAAGLVWEIGHRILGLTPWTWPLEFLP